nr:type II secretion system protein [uncultured Campylobacter sp.]
MKKGFSMTELIFVIVILGILAGVAIPRLAGTKADAEISAAAANLRTLISDAAAYYAVKDGFGTGDTITKWNEITNVPLNNPNGAVTSTDGTLRIGGKDCIAVRIQNGDDNIPAHILFLKKPGDAACKQVQNAAPLRAYFDSTVNGVKTNPGTKGAVAIGSNASLYGPAATVAAVAGPAVGAASASAATIATTAAAVATATGPRPGAASAATVAGTVTRPTAAQAARPAAQAPKPASKPAAVASASKPAKPAAQASKPAKPAKPAAQAPAARPWVTSITSPATPGSPVATAVLVWSGSRPGVPAAPIIGAGGYFSTATNKGKVTKGTGTGSTGYATPAFYKLFGR